MRTRAAGTGPCASGRKWCGRGCGPGLPALACSAHSKPDLVHTGNQAWSHARVQHDSNAVANPIAGLLEHGPLMIAMLVGVKGPGPEGLRVGHDLAGAAGRARCGDGVLAVKPEDMRFTLRQEKNGQKSPGRKRGPQGGRRGGFRARPCHRGAGVGELSALRLPTSESHWQPSESPVPLQRRWQALAGQPDSHRQPAPHWRIESKSAAISVPPTGSSPGGQMSTSARSLKDATPAFSSQLHPHPAPTLGASAAGPLPCLGRSLYGPAEVDGSCTAQSPQQRPGLSMVQSAAHVHVSSFPG